MNLRPKTKRRLLIILVTAIAITGAGTFGVILQLHRYENHRMAYRAVAMQAFQQSDYRTAADNFAKYLGNDRMDTTAIFDYAVSRSKLPRPDLSHLTEAKGLFNRYLELKPGDVEAEHQLLDIYQKLRYSAEAMETSDQLLASNPDDVPALSAKLGLMIRDHHYDQALPIAMHLNDLTPDDVQTQGLTYELMWHLHKPAGDLLDRADRMLQAHPDDPRYELLRAVAAFWTGDAEDTTKWLRTAATRPAPDAEFTLMLAGAFDRMQLWTDSRTLLEQNATAPTASVTLKANLVQRLWEIGRYDQALGVLKGVNPSDPASDSNLDGLLALVIFSKTGAAPLPPDFNAVLTALRARPDDMVATGWVSLLTAITDASPADPLNPLHLCQTARRSDSLNPDACFYLGRQYLRIGESELALQMLRQASQMQPEWAAPYVLIARTLLQRGQTTDAVKAADAAYERDPKYTAAQITFALAHYKKLPPSSSAAEIHPVLTFIQQLHNSDPDDPQLLAAEIDLLIRSDLKAQAAQVAAAAKPTPAILHQLAILNRSNHLQIDQWLADRVASCQPTTPDQALDLVQTEIVTGNINAAKSLVAAIAAHPTPGWHLAWLQAREALGDPAVHDDWKTFADSQPDNLDVQNCALRSPAVIADRDLTDRVINRLKNLTGDDAIEPKLARARWQLSGADDSRTDANDAAASMAELVRIAGDDADPQEIWADALIKLGDVNGAIAHLRLATQIEPGNTALCLRLAHLYEQQGQFSELSSLLAIAQQDNSLTNPQRIEVALLYRAIGDRSDAVKLLDDHQPMHADDPQRDIVLIQLYCEVGQAFQAAQLCDQWMHLSNPPVAVVRSVAWFWASHQSLPQARTTLEKLQNDPIHAQDRALILAEFESQWGDKTAASTDYRNLTNTSPNEPRGWLAWAGMKLRNRDFTGAFTVADEALAHLLGNLGLTAMKARAQALAGLQLDADAGGLLDTLSVDPQNEAAVAALSALADSETAADASARLQGVAEKYPRFLPVQIMLIDRDYQSGQYDQAVDRATRASESFPIEPEPARLLTMIYSASSDWEKARSAAQEWRSRMMDDPHPADLALAAAQLGLHHPDQALEQLSWWKSTSSADATAPDNARATELYLRALCEQNHTPTAWQIAQPYVRQSEPWRHRWLRLICQTAPNLGSASEWIAKIQPLMPAQSVADQLDLGEAWYTLGMRFNDPSSLEKARAITQPLTDTAAAGADAWLLLGSIQQQQNDLLAAEKSFATAVNLSPNQAVAKNNLAMMMLLRHEDLSTARQLASAAVVLSPTLSATHSTLGEIDEQLNDLPSAKSQFQLAAKLNCENAEAMIGLASVQSRAGEISSAVFTLQQAQAVLDETHANLPSPVRAELARLIELTKQPATQPTATRN